MNPAHNRCGVIPSTGDSMEKKIVGLVADLSWEFAWAKRWLNKGSICQCHSLEKPMR
jgi:hypothetical protein